MNVASGSTRHPEIGDLPALRLELVDDRPPRAEGDYVVYWMTAARRLRWNFALDRAVAWAEELQRPLVIVEVIGCGGRWDCDRFHRFLLQGARNHVCQARDFPVRYYPYLERKPGAGRRFLTELGRRACVVVTDNYPIRLPSVDTLPAELPCRCEKIDGNGLLPIRAADRAFPTAYAFRRMLQRVLPEHMLAAPQADPLDSVRLPALGELPEQLTRRWPPVSFERSERELAKLPIEHGVPPAPPEGGSGAAVDRWRGFLNHQLPAYPDRRNQPEADGSSRLSPYLHFGHISTHEVFHDLAREEDWNPTLLADKATGARAGWWGMSEWAEAFLDQFITWRELGFNGCTFLPHYDRYASLPDWARATLAQHAADPRPYVYSPAEFDAAQTHDPLWNAAQTQLRTQGVIHNYLRMLWGKKILEWTSHPEEALEIMIDLNNRYALDGQDPNSYSGIFWILGRYDRAWGPKRPIFGTVRFMSSTNTARKFRVRNYIQEHSADPRLDSEETAGDGCGTVGERLDP